MVILALLGIFMDRKMYGKKMPASKYRASKHRLPASRTDNNRRSGSNQSFERGVTASKTKLTEITTKQTCSLKYQKPKRHERRGVWKHFLTLRFTVVFRPQITWWFSRDAGNCWPQEGSLDCSDTSDRPCTYYTVWKHQAFWVACSEGLHCANTFRMGASNSPFPLKSCACASVAFQAKIISWPVDSIYSDSQ